VKTETSTAGGTARAPSFDEFFREWFPPVARAMALIVHDLGDGQEIAQEGFVRAHRHWSSMVSAEHARRFVFRASINLARSHLRRRRPFELIGLGETQLLGSVSDPSESSDERIILAQAVSGLSRRQRECVVLVDYLGYDAGSAARILRLAPPTVRVHLARGREHLREHLSRGKEKP
jgi:RNA polymerase sigma factor (sigma-70 family)